MVEYSLYPICDTNILIALNLGKVFDAFLSSIKNLNVADKVKDEMENKFVNSDNYSYFLNVFDEKNVRIIDESIFTPKVHQSICATLRQYKIQNFMGIKAYTKDAGEFASALYAVNLDIKKVYTNDMVFITSYGQEHIFKNLIFVNLNDTLAEFLSNKQRIQVNAQIQMKNDIMKVKLNEENEEKTKSDLIKKMMKMYNH